MDITTKHPKPIAQSWLNWKFKLGGEEDQA